VQRYFIQEDQWKNNLITITGEDYHHMTRVMRMNINDEVICNHISGTSAICKIKEINNEVIILEVLNYLDEENELPIKVTIAQGLPKRDKLEFVLQKGTELGASRFIPFKAARSVVKWNKKKEKSRLKRYRKIVKEASEQSHRQILPTVEAPETIQELVQTSQQYNLKIVAYEEESKRTKF